jgi:hypothetical protein
MKPADAAILRAAQSLPEFILRTVCEIKAARIAAAKIYPGVFPDAAARILPDLLEIGCRRFGSCFARGLA